jgi:hypothetical protein
MGSYNVLMAQPLTDAQKLVASQRLLMGNLLSPELAQAMMRATLAAAENATPETGLLEFVCGIYLQCGENFARHFSGNLDLLVNAVFPKHRKGDYGLVPEQSLDLPSGGESCDFGTGWNVKFSADLSRVLWNSGRLAAAVGKPASLLDFIAAFGTDDSALKILHQSGLSLKGEMPDFDTEFGTVIFSITFFAQKDWPAEKEFDLDDQFVGPYSLEVRNPTGRFRPIKEGKVLLNGDPVASITDAVPAFKVPAQLQPKNTISVALKGVTFEGIDVIIRGTRR